MTSEDDSNDRCWGDDWDDDPEDDPYDESYSELYDEVENIELLCPHPFLIYFHVDGSTSLMPNSQSSRHVLSEERHEYGTGHHSEIRVPLEYRKEVFGILRDSEVALNDRGSRPLSNALENLSRRTRSAVRGVSVDLSEDDVRLLVELEEEAKIFQRRWPA